MNVTTESTKLLAFAAYLRDEAFDDWEMLEVMYDDPRHLRPQEVAEALEFLLKQ